MSLLLTLLVCTAMVGTSFLSGIFGMAGGLVLIGILLALLPLPDAMALHGVTQLSSNTWRAAAWVRHIRWRSVAAYAVGVGAALAGWAWVQFVPGRAEALLLLGLSSLGTRLLPSRLKPDADSIAQGIAYGAACMALMLLTGVAGPLLDRFFLGGTLDRRAIVATKATCQTLGHLGKTLYFGALIEQAGVLDPLAAGLAIAASFAGTALARPVLERMSDAAFRRWANRLVTGISLWFVAQGSWMLLTR